MGHTDATGGDSYNSTLSMRRAEAVKGYLTTTWNIPSDQLKIQGAGESQPLAGTDPDDGINRRVEFFALN
ncbi:MAG: OmpA family protein, partial [Geminicoccaceae bacterium]